MAEDDTKAKIAALEAKRAARRDETAKARERQYAIDLEAIDALGIEHGDDRIGVLPMPSFVADLPTAVVVKTPTTALFNRFRSMVRKAKGDAEALGSAKDLLAASCVVYPQPEVYERMKASWPSIHDNVGIEAIRLGEAEGKA